MATSDESPEATTETDGGRVALRLNLAGTTLGRGPLDGAWWPQSRDLKTEATDLINNFPAVHGRIEHLEYSASHWRTPDRKINTAHGTTKAEASRRADAHLMDLTMSIGRTVRLLVLPAGMNETDARLIMYRAAFDPDQADPLVALPDGGPVAAADPRCDERWVDYGDEFWAPDPVPPQSARGDLRSRYTTGRRRSRQERDSG